MHWDNWISTRRPGAKRGREGRVGPGEGLGMHWEPMKGKDRPSGAA